MPASNPPISLSSPKPFHPEINGVAMTVGGLVGGLRERGHRVRMGPPAPGKADTGSEHELALPGVPLPGLRRPAFRPAGRPAAASRMAPQQAGPGACRY